MSGAIQNRSFGRFPLLILLCGIVGAATILGATLPGQWRNRAPEGSAQGSLLVDPSDPSLLYTTTPAGLFQSLDRGTTWTQLYSGSISGFTVDRRNDRHLLLSTGETLAESTDRGETWATKPLPTAPGWIFEYSILEIDPFDPETFYAGAALIPRTGIMRGGVLYRSPDAGQSWAEIAYYPVSLTGFVV